MIAGTPEREGTDDHVAAVSSRHASFLVGELVSLLAIAGVVVTLRSSTLDGQSELRGCGLRRVKPW
jgi:hypothetical protein